MTALLVLLVLSVLAPALAVRLRIPAAVMLIVAGVGFGPAGLGLLDDSPSVALLSELGFLILMFVAGMEIDFEALRRAGSRGLVLPSLCVLLFFVVAAVVGIWMHLSVLELIAVSASSVGMPLAVLQEEGQLQNPLGRHVMLTASLGEFVSILAITGYEVFVEEPTMTHRLIKLVKVLFLFALSAAVIRWARAAVWWRPQLFRRLLHHHDVAELGVRTGLLIMLAFVVAAATLGVEAILGAFIAGALVAFVLREKSTLESKISALGQGLFIPIFFIVVGMRFNLRVLTLQSARNAVAFAGVVTAAKILPTLLSSPRELDLRARFAAGSLLAAPLTLLVAIATIGRRLGTLDADRETTFVLLALLLSVGFPIVFRAMLAKPAPARTSG